MSFLSKILSIGQEVVRNHLQSEKVQKLKDRADLEAQIVRDRRSNSPFTWFHEQRLIDTDRDIARFEDQLFQSEQSLIDPGTSIFDSPSDSSPF